VGSHVRHVGGGGGEGRTHVPDFYVIDAKGGVRRSKRE
jgi:hypothetical protein